MIGVTDDDREELWNSLGVEDTDAVIEVMLLAKTRDMDTGNTAVCIGTAGRLDWVSQVGLLAAARVLIERDD